ncbi:hypothetical protein, partial [Thermococcus sp.]
QENWSKVHVFLKLATSRDFWKLAKPWDVDYSHVKVVKHTIEYDGEKITMLAMGIPLKDGKHVIALYEFSKPVEGVGDIGYILEVNNGFVKPEKVLINGKVQDASCQHECKSNSDCGFLGKCNYYCCKFNWVVAAACCIQCVDKDGEVNPVCLFAVCPLCVYASCEEWGSYCSGWTPGP